MTTRAKLATITALSIAAMELAALLSWSPQAAAASIVPPARLVEPGQGSREVAVLAGGCFWGVEAVFEHVRGVLDVRSGYAGGNPRLANYGSVSGGRSGNAEVVRIIFDPRIVSYDRLLRVHFAVAHDPTQLNRQGPDVGPQYRSAIFPQSPGQAKVARAYIDQLSKARIFTAPIATRIEQGRFVEAETHHQDFMRKHPAHPYIVIHDRPKLAELKRRFPDLWRA